jgi:putative hydrolase of the HAD superfamily
MIEAVLFDYGMVLSGPADPASWLEMQRITAIAEDRLDAAYWAPRHAYDRGTHTGTEYWKAVGHHAGININSDQILALIRADTALWTTVNPPMIEWADRLQTAGTKTGILSNLGDEMTKGVLERMPWMEAFHHRTFSHSLKRAKPEIEIYRHAAEGLNTPPSGILFIDDRVENCEAGRLAGMQVVQYGHQEAFVSEMRVRGWEQLWLTGRLQG